MSADNWAVCPRCLASKQAEAKKKRAELDAAYGKVSRDRYEQMKSRVEELETDVKSPDTRLREDYHQGIDPAGMYSVGYNASCQECDFEFSYTSEVNTDASARTARK